MKDKYKELESIEPAKDIVLDYIRKILDKYQIKYISEKKFKQKYKEDKKCLRKTTISLCDSEKRIIYLVEDNNLFKKDRDRIGRIPHEILEAIILDEDIYNCDISNDEKIRKIRHKDIYQLERRVLKYAKKLNK